MSRDVVFRGRFCSEGLRLRPHLRGVLCWVVAVTICPALSEQVFALSPGVAANVSSAPGNFVRAGGRTFFTATCGDRVGLWTSDGTPEGTVLVKRFPPDAGPSYLTGSAEVLYFVVGQFGNQPELWRSDGTSAGTVAVKRFPPGVILDHLTALAGSIYFEAGNALWRSDGTTEGTLVVRELADADLSGLTEVSGLLFFFTSEHVPPGAPVLTFKLWKSDGTAQGTVLLKEFSPSNQLESFPRDLVAHDGRLFFVSGLFDGGDPISWAGKELWSSDGTAEGTAVVRDIVPGFEGSVPDDLTVAGALLFFTAGDERSAPRYLWRTDGTEEGTRLVKEVSPSNLVPAGPYLYFTEFDSDSDSDALWRSDGTADGTLPVRSFPGQWAYPLVGFQESLILGVTDRASSAEALWRSDGSESGTTLLRNGIQVHVTDPFFGQFSSFAETNGVLLFAADDGSTGSELWRTDGTPAGTVQVEDLAVGPCTCRPGEVGCPGECACLPGDGNCDGRVTAADLVEIARIVGGSAIGCAGADARADGEVNRADANATVNLLFGEGLCSEGSAQPLSIVRVDGEGFAQCDQVAEVLEVDVVQGICSGAGDDRPEPFTETFVRVWVNNRTSTDFLIGSVAVGTSAFMRFRLTSQLAPGARCSNAPATPCASDADCPALPSGGFCKSSTTPVEFSLLDYTDKALIADAAGARLPVSIVLSATNTAGDIVDATTQVLADVDDYDRCACSLQ